MINDKGIAGNVSGSVSLGVEGLHLGDLRVG